MTGIVTAYAVFASAQEAETIARTLVDEGLAACANILGAAKSIYRWEGEVQEAEEVPVLFKTSAAQSDALIARIAELHSYEVPAVTVWPIAQALPAYAEWVKAEAVE